MIPNQYLSDAIRARREHLHLTRQAVNDRGGPSAVTLRALESGSYARALRSFTIDRLERSLDWAPGTVRRVIDGAAAPRARHQSCRHELKARQLAKTDTPVAVLLRCLLSLIDEARAQSCSICGGEA